MPGDRHDLTVARLVQAEGGVDRGETGSDEEDGVLRAECGERTRCPRVIDPPGASPTEGPRPRRGGRSRGEDDPVERPSAVVGQGDLDLGTLRGHADGTGREVFDRFEQGAQVLAVPCPGHERVAVEPAAPTGPRHEVVGRVGQGAHAAGTDVEEVARVVRAVGDPSAQLGSGLDDDDSDGNGCIPHEVDGSQYPGCPSTDHADQLAFRCHAGILILLILSGKPIKADRISQESGPSDFEGRHGLQ